MEELRLAGIFGDHLVQTSAQVVPPTAGCPGPLFDHLYTDKALSYI